MKLGKHTQSVHAGTRFDETTGGANTPIYTSTANKFIASENQFYPRYFNTLNQQSVVDKLCALEHAEAGRIFGSGMAAISTGIFALVNPGDHVVFQGDLYGGTTYLIKEELSRINVSFTFVDGHELNAFEEAINDKTVLLYIESPSNPLLNLVDVAGISALAKKHGLKTMIDNTFASPVNQNPIKMGIDLVAHSGTKYLGGHSDICCGALLGSKEIMEQVHSRAIAYGGSLDSQTCYLLERSLKTLVLRVERQNANAMAVAEYLEKHPKVAKVNYPGLPSHKHHELAKKQMSGFGGMLSFELKGSAKDVVEMFKRLKLILPALSLGGVESTICQPLLTSHSKISAEERKQLGIKDELIRFSVGIEDPKDLCADLNQALIG